MIKLKEIKYRDVNINNKALLTGKRENSGLGRKKTNEMLIMGIITASG